MSAKVFTRLRPVAFIALLLVAWGIAAARSSTHILPGPFAVAGGIVELSQRGLLLKYIVASLFRVTWGYVSAALLAIPIGLTIGWYRPSEMAPYSLIQNF